MISVLLLGTGNVANHLSNVFLRTDNINLVQVYGRTSSSLKKFKSKVDTTTKLNDLKKADVYIIAISDDAISEFSSLLNLKDKLVVHTSGSVSMSNLKSISNKGVFYPIQTFTKNKVVNFVTVPICIEAERHEDLALLQVLASLISDKVYPIDSIQRKYIHLAAVFTNNFVNHMYKIGSDICEEHHIPFEILQPLILESAEKIKSNTPKSIQTGPAIRNDNHTISNHLELLKNSNKEIYNLLTQSIQDTYGKKL